MVNTWKMCIYFLASLMLILSQSLSCTEELLTNTYLTSRIGAICIPWDPISSTEFSPIAELVLYSQPSVGRKLNYHKIIFTHWQSPSCLSCVCLESLPSVFIVIIYVNQQSSCFAALCLHPVASLQVKQSTNVGIAVGKDGLLRVVFFKVGKF